MSEAYNKSVKLYWMAKNTASPNRAFNVESKRVAVHDDYHACLRLLSHYTRAHDTSIVAYAIWGGRIRLGLKFHGKAVTIGVVKNDDIEVGVTHEIRNPYELQRYLENRMGFTIANLNEELFEKARERLMKIESELNIRIDPEETKKWFTQPYHQHPFRNDE
jgi:hypothetical protein